MNYFESPEKGSGKRKIVVKDNVPDLFSDPIPITPYKGEVMPTMGHSGSVTSEIRAVEEVISGNASKRQLHTLSLLDRAGMRGMTWKELDVASGNNHHGKSSAALTVLHQGKRIIRLQESRDMCLVYVLPAYVDGRAISPLTGSRCGCGKYLKVSYLFCPYCGNRKD